MIPNGPITGKWRFHQGHTVYPRKAPGRQGELNPQGKRSVMQGGGALTKLREMFVQNGAN